MQVWPSSDTFLEFHAVPFQVLVHVKGSSLSGGGLTVTLYKHLELEALWKAKTLQGVIHTPLCFLPDEARQHSHTTCAAIEYWISNHSQASRG